MRRIAKNLAVAATAVAVTAVAGPALADGWKHKHRHHHHYDYYDVRPRAVIVERPVVVYSRPRMVYPEPMYYGPPAPPSVNLIIPLR